MMTLNGRTQTTAQWAREIGVSADAIERRINLLKWSDEKALTTPPRGWGPGKPKAVTVEQPQKVK